MATKLDLLQKLLQHRNEVIIMYHGVALCSCGHRFSDYSDIENHLVQKHEKLSADQETSSRKAFSFSDVLKDVINNVNEEATNIGQLDIALPPKTFAVVLDEETIDGGRIENVNCDECSVTCWSFKTLKDHYLRQHPGLWTSKETCVKVPRIIFSKPNREHQNRLPKSWHYDFYCPIPGCKYHLNQHLQDTQEQPKTFRSAALLKQHYSKIHASKSKICPKCEAAFSTEVFLRRHQKTTCGRSFQCQTCHSVFSAMENLQTHCRRKNHRLLPSPSSIAHAQTNVCRLTSSKPTPSKGLQKRPLENYSKSSSNRNYLKIAPMPPSLTMTAAIALSELSSKPSSSVLTKNPAEKVEEDKTQALWSASLATQTSPRGGLGPEIPEESILPSRTSGKIPKLGDPKLEQFSTETQTDDLELLLKPASAPAASQHVADAFTIEAQTQFDLDDILCSNYTQTIFDTSLDPSTSTGAPVNTAETQTSMLMSYDLVNMETQTLLFGDEEEVNS